MFQPNNIDFQLLLLLQVPRSRDKRGCVVPAAEFPPVLPSMCILLTFFISRFVSAVRMV